MGCFDREIANLSQAAQNIRESQQGLTEMLVEDF